MKIVNSNAKFSIAKWIKLSFVLASFIFGMMYAAFQYKRARIIPAKLGLEYVRKTGFKLLNNAIHSNTDSIQTIYLDIKYKEWRKLVNQRNKVWNYNTVLKYFPFQWTDTIEKIEIKGKINYLNEVKKVKLKLMGMNSDHYGDSKKWSFRISMKGDNTIDGQKKFNLLIPPSRDYVNDFVGQKFLQELGMISLRIKPIKLVLNGEHLGIYNKEEFYDKRLIEYNRHRESAIIRLHNYDIGISENKYLKYKDILDKFKRKVNLVKNNKKTVLDLFNLDKMADRVAMSILFGDYHSLIHFNQRYYLNPFTVKLEPLAREFHFSQYSNKNSVIENYNKIKNLENTLYPKLFKSKEFIEKLNKSICRISSKHFIKTLNQKYSKDIEIFKKAFYSEYLFFDTPKSLIDKNAELLRMKNNWIVPKDTTRKKHPLVNLIKYAKVYKDTILIDKSISIDEQLHIPPGYKVIIRPGVQLSLEDNGQIISESPFIAIGTKKDSIKFKAQKKNNDIGGILFLNTKGSKFKFVKFTNLKNYNDTFRTLPGSVCFYESTVSFSNTTFDTNYGGDDLLNMVRSKFSITDSELLNSKADALDSDFSTGHIENTLFKNIGNDAIDVSGTKLDVFNIIIRNVKDKGISVGEDSHIKGTDVRIQNSSLALTSKDFSTLKLNRVTIDSCDVVFTVFQKKPEYGPALINCKNVTYTNYKEEYLVQEKSQLMVNLKARNKRVKDVESKLYGAIYGKSSK